jgi:hypothetical protein
MNSPFAQLFLALTDQLKTVLPPHAYIDQDLGQLEYYEIRPAVSWPCALIDIDSFTFQELGDGSQMAEGDVVIRLAFPPYSSAKSTTPQEYREKALGFYEIEWAINKALHCWSPGDTFGSLTRISAQTERREDPIRVRELRYKLALEDYSTEEVLLRIGGEYNPSDYDSAEYRTTVPVRIFI